YDLPNTTAYNETCAAIANVYWNHRMFLLHGDSKYIDVLEKSLYNGLLSGIGLDGKSFFYSNAMQVKHSFNHRALEISRAGWFDCSCCPTNMARLLPSVPGYMYAQKENNIYVNLFAASTTEITVNNKPVTILQENNYPWSGALKFVVSPKSSSDFNLMIRIPGWAENKVLPSDLYSFASAANGAVDIKINGEKVAYQMQKGYAVLSKRWKKGDVVEVALPMDVKLVKSNQILKENEGKTAVQRGPLVYCAEWVDNGGRTSNILLPSSASFNVEEKKELLNGVTVVRTSAPVIAISEDGQRVTTENKTVTLIPYYAWANRGKGEMMVWFPTRIKDMDLITTGSKLEENKSK
ncbi:MAG TPA: beta-L-arabinofuranosidase domain-containing protein, partial [Flavisolibacter sp.]|nr:beta-L-arabinofuranosidase domain-containing protein [Flavisolibacter sp.]